MLQRGGAADVAGPAHAMAVIFMQSTETRWRSTIARIIHTLLGPNPFPKLVAFALWLILFLAYEAYVFAQGLDQLDLVGRLVSAMQRSAFGPLFFVLFYAVQPLLFFPSWLLSAAAGYVYGPVRGFAYLLVAVNLAALVAYGAGRYFGAGAIAQPAGQGRLHRYIDRLRAHSFETVLLLRLLFLPFDALSYLAGFLHLPLGGFMLATLLGSIPGSLAFVLFGASIEGGLDGRRVHISPWTFLLSAGLFTVSILMWRLLGRKFEGEEEK